jgi:hypothetical protein
MGSMETISLILATTAISVLLTWFLTARRQALSPTHGPLAPVWREGYLTGVADERTSAAWEVPGYGPNRCNPYRGSEKDSGNA